MTIEEQLLAVLRAQAYRGACRIEDRKTLAEELGVSVGKLSAVLYALCGEGRILLDHDIVLLLMD